MRRLYSLHSLQLIVSPPVHVAGFCALCRTLPPSRSGAETEVSTRAVVKCNGLNADFSETFHCVAAEPHATFLRISVTDRGQEVAYETAVLGRLRGGYRVFQLRGPLGTRIELCYLFVHISFESDPWASSFGQVPLYAAHSCESLVAFL